MPGPIALDQVLADELKEIVERRKKAFPTDEVPQNGDAAVAVQDSLVGLAISGGGVRSAMFNLGVLQVLHDRGVMKFVDYVSSVSGGGYISAYYSVLGYTGKLTDKPVGAATDAQDRLTRQAEATANGVKTPVVPAADPGAATELKQTDGSLLAALASPVSSNGHPTPEPSAERSARKPASAADRPKPQSAPLLYYTDKQFCTDGRYLMQPLRLLGQYIPSTVRNLIHFAAGLLMVGSAIALFFRLFDLPGVRVYFRALGIDSDLNAALVGAAAFALAAILVLWASRSFGGELGRTRGMYLIVLPFALFCSLAIMLGNGDFYLWTTPGSNLSFSLTSLSLLQIPLYTIVVIVLFGSINARSLLKSERANAGWFRRVGLRAVLLVAGAGAFFAATSFVGQENVSGYTKVRSPAVRYDDLRDPQRAVAMMRFFDGVRKVSEFEEKAKKVELTALASAAALESLDPKNQLTPEPFDFFRQTVGRTAMRTARVATHSIANSPTVPEHLAISLSWELRQEFDELLSNFNERLFKDDAGAAELRAACFDALLVRISKTYAGSTAVQPNPSVGQPLEVFLSLWRAPPARTAIDDGAVLGEFDEFAAATAKAFPVESSQQKAMLPAVRGLVSQYLQARGAQPEDRFVAAFSTSDSQMQALRALTETVFVNAIKPTTMISTPVLVVADQYARLWWLLGSAVVFAALTWTYDLNLRSPIRRFYESRLKRAFLGRLDFSGVGEEVEAVGLQLKYLKPHLHGWPYPLFVAAVRNLGYRRRTSYGEHEDAVANSEWYSFVFSPRFCGWLPVPRPTSAALWPKSYAETSAYVGDRLTVARAVALSGAAVTPWMANHATLRFLMHLFNLRLEHWMPNPGRPELADDSRMPLLQAMRAWRAAPGEPIANWGRAPIADGGFREFLAVEELLVRRCGLVIAIDAGCNNGLYEFGVVSDLVRRMRVEHDVEILDLDHELPLDVARLRRVAAGEELQNRNTEHFIIGRIRYPDRPVEALFVYVQMSLTGDEDIDLQQFQRLNPNFPDEPTTNQFFGEKQVESYRQLGQHIAQQLCQRFAYDAIYRAKSADSCASQGGRTEFAVRCEHRLELLKQSFVGAYLLDCLQERIVAEDDASPDWPLLNVQTPSLASANEILREYETGGQLSVATANLVSHVLSGPTGDDDKSWTDDLEVHIDCLQDALASVMPPGADLDDCVAGLLAPLAVECNRRYAGYRLENPARFFKVGGRQQLLGATAHAMTRFPAALDDDRQLADALARFSVLLTQGVFRQFPVQTATDAVLCICCWREMRTRRQGSRLRELTSAAVRMRLRSTVSARVASDTARFLFDRLTNAEPHPKKKPTRKPKKPPAAEIPLPKKG